MNLVMNYQMIKNISLYGRDKMLFICYEICSTCKKAEKFLNDHGITFTKRAINTDNPTYEELKKWVKMSNLPINKFFNTSGKLYRELSIKDKLKDMSDDEILKLLSTDGMLVKRPLLISEDKVLVGFKEEEYQKLDEEH